MVETQTGRLACIDHKEDAPKWLPVGHETETLHELTPQLIEKFGEVSGDRNPLHFNEDYASETRFKGIIGHGIIAGAWISADIAELGLNLPNGSMRTPIYLHQEYDFRGPAKPGDLILVVLKILKTEEDRRTISTDCFKLKDTLLRERSAQILKGEALIQFDPYPFRKKLSHSSQL